MTTSESTPDTPSFTLTLNTLEGVPFDGPIFLARLTALDGRLEVRPGHASLISALKPGLMTLVAPGHDPEDPLFFMVCGGVAHVFPKKVEIFTPRAYAVEDENELPLDDTSYTWEENDKVLPSLEIL